jgi:hypothetical protein
MKLQVLLDHQSTQGVADQHGRFDEAGRGLVHVGDVVVDAVPDPPWWLVVAAQPHGLNLVAVAPASRSAKPSQHQGPCQAPCTSSTPAMSRTALLLGRSTELAGVCNR